MPDATLIGSEPPTKYSPDMDEETIRLFEWVKPHTMTGIARVHALRRAVEYVARCDIPGDVVECGVWRGGSMMAVARTLVENNSADRTLHLFDTFEGMTEPTEADRDVDGTPAAQWLGQGDRDVNDVWSYAPLDEVKRAMALTGYDQGRIRYVKGKVEETLPCHAPKQIALLRLDTDWYESTYHELVHLYPRLSKGGVLIIDDYGHWQGARQAVDEYFAARPEPVYLHRVDYTARLVVRQDGA